MSITKGIVSPIFKQNLVSSIVRSILNIDETLFTPLDLFRNNEQGVWYDPSDLTTLYQDAAGTIPVLADGDPVGLMLDKSKGLELGPELITNGTFDTDTNWIKGTGWTISGGVATYNGVGGNDLDQSVTLTANSSYEVTFNITSYTSGSVRPRWGSFAGPFVGGVGLKKVIGLSSAESTIFTIDPASFDGSIDNISVREIKGNHATQSVAAQRPTFDDAPPSVIFDAVDDNHITNLPDLGADVTIAYASPGVGAVIQTGQAISAGNYVWNTNHAGLIIVNRALTSAETTAVTAHLNTKAGV